MKRLFIAVEFVPDNNFFDVYSKVSAISTKLDRINWVKPDLIHLTLKFLGETPEEKIPFIAEKMKSAVLGITPFELKIGEIGAFGSRYQPKVLWFGVQKNETIEQLHAQLQKEMRKLGFKPDFGNFVPHITIARINKIDNKQKFWKSIESLQIPFIQEVKVKKIILYESILKTYIPVYEKIEEVFF
jgi:2'-5' RNA ligase